MWIRTARMCHNPDYFWIIYILSFVLFLSVCDSSFIDNLIPHQKFLNDQFSKYGRVSQKSNHRDFTEPSEEGGDTPPDAVDEEHQLPLLNLPPHSQIYDIPLDNNDTHHLYWQVSYDTESVRIEVHSRAVSQHPWLGLGFSDRGEIEGSDMCVFWVDWRKRAHFNNVLVDPGGRMKIFPTHECHNFRFKIQKGILKFSFTRRFDTCLPDHYNIERGTTHIVWAWGEGPLYKLDGVLAKGDLHGLVRVELLKPSLPKSELKNVKELQISSKAAKVPNEETNYWCTVHKLPKIFNKKHHIFKFGPKIEKGNEDIVHHMEVFHCEHPPEFEVSMYEGPCHAPDRPKEVDACKRVLAAWAMGAEPFVYPQEAGMSIGGKDFNPFVMLEVHYNNPKLIQGRVDSSGMLLTYSSHLREYDAGIMELGLEYIDKMAIPPHMELFTLAGYCIPECTALGIPHGGIYIFGSQLHTHLTGIRTWTLHYRGENELPELNRDNHYSTHFQEIRRLPEPVHVLPGDSLIMGCDYATKGRENVTVGGFAISDEMCVNYVHYYPKIDLEVCKSSVDSKTLIDYFDFMNRLELQDTSPKLSWRQNYKAIKWTPLRSDFLQSFYRDSPISMQCNKSSGERFPGYWENKPLPSVLHPLEVLERNCDSKKHMKHTGDIIVL